MLFAPHLISALLPYSRMHAQTFQSLIYIGSVGEGGNGFKSSWVEYYSQKYQRFYYCRDETGDNSWEIPPSVSVACLMRGKGNTIDASWMHDAACITRRQYTSPQLHVGHGTACRACSTMVNANALVAIIPELPLQSLCMHVDAAARLDARLQLVRRQRVHCKVDSGACGNNNVCLQQALTH